MEGNETIMKQAQQLPQLLGALMGWKEDVFGVWTKDGERCCVHFSPHLDHNHWAMFCSWLHEHGYGWAFETELRNASPSLITNTPLDLRCRAALVAIKQIKVALEEKEISPEVGRHRLPRKHK